MADDDETIRAEMSELLRADGHEVDAAADGSEALKKLETGAYDAVLLDLVMPRASGLDVLRRARIAAPDTAVVMVTGQGTIDAAVESMKAGAADFIQKPPEIASIQNVLRAVAEEKAARAMLAQATRASEAARTVMEEAVRRKALLAVLGPGSKAPKGVARALQIDDEARPPNVFTPAQLFQINAAVEGHIAATERPVVLVSGLKPLEETHGRDDVLAWLRQVSDRCATRDGTLIVGSADADYARGIQAAAAGTHVDAGLQGMLESLANPARRAVVAFVFDSTPVAYSAILRQNFVDSSSKLSFHLQKLQADGLLTKVEGGQYGLTEDGRRAWRVVRALQDERRRPSLLVAPP